MSRRDVPGDSRAPSVSRRRVLRSAGAGALASLAGCASLGAPDARPEFVGTLSTTPAHFDPTAATDTASQKVNGLVYDTLLAIGFDGTPRPALAERFERRDDLTWRVHLRDGVTFHDGSSLTAADVQATLERYEGTPRESDVFAWYDGSTVRDDLTLDLSLSTPYAPLQTELGGIPVVPAAAADSLDLSTRPVGTGPFRYEGHEPDSYVRLARYDDHWFDGSDAVPETPPIRRVTLRVIGDQSGQLAALRGGDVDLANSPSAPDVASLRENDAYTVTEAVAGGFEFLIFPMASSPYDNRDVRRGITRRVPRADIIDAVFDGIGQPAYAPVSPLVERFTSADFQERMAEEYAGYDPERADELLARGLADAGVDTPFEATLTTNQNEARLKWSQLVVDSLNESPHLDVTLETYEWSTYRDVIFADDSHESGVMMALGYSGGWDPDGYVHDLFHSEQATPSCCNFPHYRNDRVDELIERGLRTYDVAERRDVYQELQERIVADAPVAFVRFGKRLDAFRTDRVEGFRTYPLDGGEYAALYAPTAGVYTRLSNT